MWKSKLTSILSIMSNTTLATFRHSRVCPKGQLFRSMSDSLGVTLPNRMYAKCHGKTLASMMGLKWASMVIPLIEQEMIAEGELIQIASEKHLTPSDHSFFMASSSNAPLRGSRGKGGTVGLREDSVERF